MAGWQDMGTVNSAFIKTGEAFLYLLAHIMPPTDFHDTKTPVEKILFKIMWYFNCLK
jgi:hypothetical protein